MMGRPLHERFDLVFGTSTGAIIAALIALGKSIEEIHSLYREYVPRIMRPSSPSVRSRALATLADSVFAEARFEDVKTRLGVVAARWDFELPMIFKSSMDLSHGRLATFVPGFGCTISDAVQASCSAYPFFERKVVLTSTGDRIELVDGGYCANNPTLYAIADAITVPRMEYEALRVVSVGVGVYPEPKRFGWPWLVRRLKTVQLLQKTLDINTHSMDQLRIVLFRRVPTIRISDTFAQPEMATDLLEHNLTKLNTLYQRGGESYAKHEIQLKQFLL
jgi:predicted acylesterase/phospholipase RssA